MLTPNHRESWKVTFDFVVQQVFVLLSTVFYVSHLVIHATKLKLYELKIVWQSSIVWNSVAGVVLGAYCRTSAMICRHA